ncbi:DoxX family protein [Derxia lacustris]|uniref:DoxX family protein n=1 Tax=Derxia lacustris TaxID=764842 RepID=UPI000A16F11F|nr:DoxX family protein [Derxia lacustris]
MGVDLSSRGARLLLVLLTAAYWQGGALKLLDHAGAVAEMQHFGLAPAGLFAVAVPAFELLAALAVILGPGRRPAAVALALFTLAASVLANPFWAQTGPGRAMTMNAFFEHLGLVGGLLLVAHRPTDRDR